ncbi:MAG: hypothetical protein H7174_08095 [Flavobacterium sp.]|nr:hypothetical protein [Flavobacterium sp.]
MKSYLYICLFSLILSCKDDSKIRLAENLKDIKKKEVIFANINKNWTFNAIPSNTTSRELTTKWTEWRIFLDELSKKPNSTIGAFQQKAKNLSKKALELKTKIPIKFNGPAIKARITVLITKVNSLDLYINLNQIPDDKVIILINEINKEVQSLQLQMDEITKRSQIQTESGESDLIKMMDTTRAIPNVPMNVGQNVQ